MSKGGIDLPSRVLLTSIFDSLAAIQIPTPEPSATLPPTSTSTFSNLPIPTANPIRFLPAASRNIFLTAHCLLPTTFLAALDLLEKSLVERYTTVDTPTSAPKVYYIRSNPPPPQSLVIPGPNFTSTSTQKSGFPKSGKSYIYEVRPAVWNCTCITFTLAAYQRHTLLHTQNKGYGFDPDDEVGFEGENSFEEEQDEDIENQGGNSIGGEDGEEEDYGDDTSGSDGVFDKDNWYGGIYTLDSESTSKKKAKKSVVPICKHLLAAVLAEKCQSLFGGYVIEKVVTTDEMAEMAVLWE
ncbi:hypothetical protein TWF102_004953 [Orbilia oligospora]|uniref:SWIM-type domain-containing protein n=1 Tax=Orbilia oligospora TaxID=2813651 RepID=A0A7C8JAW3_ORBOL|nr:hypothetical protein TWF103_000954 [Orbilia oligospora]KAF3101143.1 hypothetical protein TWF102_004953 [Orbilia oligospora]